VHRERRDETDSSEAFVEELLTTALSLAAVLTSLLEDLPDNAFPGEDPGDVLLEMLAGSARPAIDAVGESSCRIATALVGAVRDRVLEDLRAAAELAEAGQSEVTREREDDS
jgi:hypothetical protein